MNAVTPQALSSADCAKISSAHRKHGVVMRKNLAESGGDQVAASRKAFAALLWRAFPSPSEHELALKAARVLDVSPRQVKNWLRCENSAAIHYFFAVAAIAGVEMALPQRAVA